MPVQSITTFHHECSIDSLALGAQACLLVWTHLPRDKEIEDDIEYKARPLSQIPRWGQGLLRGCSNGSIDYREGSMVWDFTAKERSAHVVRAKVGSGGD